MTKLLPELRWSDKERLRKHLRECRNIALRIRYLILVNLIYGRSVGETMLAPQVGRSTVYKVAKRFREEGEAGLVDRREDNGQRKWDEDYLAKLYEVVASTPKDYYWRRPTWTRELLVETLVWEMGVRIHVSTRSTALRIIRARLGRPKPTVGCPWSKRAKNQRLREIQNLIQNLPDEDVVLYADEVDVHLNPKIGPDWMVQGQQKEVQTPGKNIKRSLAGALDSRTKELIWGEGEKKDSLLFILLLWELVQRYPQAKVIHVILDNYSIHSTQQVELSLATTMGPRLRLEFLPPYRPDHNRIERAGRDLHANVTRNHQCETINELMIEVRYWLRKRNRKIPKTLAA